jgi:hypothetical protein
LLPRGDALKITVTIDDPTDDFKQRLLDLLAEHAAAVVIDTGWTHERAKQYELSLPARARAILRAAVARGGYVSADVLRGPDGTGTLTGHSAAFKQALERGVRKGWWPDGTPAPVVAHGPGFGKVAGYGIASEAWPAFETAALTARIDAKLHDGATQRDTLAQAISTQTGDWDAERTVVALHAAGHDTVDYKRARAILRDLADTGLIVKTDPEQALYRRAEAR